MSEVFAFAGAVLHLQRSPGASQPMEHLAQATLEAGVGLAGDRYATRTGTYSARHHIDRQVTLIEVETLEALWRDRSVRLEPAEHRRNVTSVGVPLNHLVGRYFRVGACVLYGGRLNVPCKYLEELVAKPVMRAMLNRSGLNARIIVGGVIRPGDKIEPVDRDSLDEALVIANEQTPTQPAPDVF
ncbi:MAG: MOSC domain-containing protein [Acidimicrobiales bacterium]